MDGCMTDEPEDAEGEDENAAIVKAALDLYDAWMLRERGNIEEAYDDLEFRAGNQWHDEDLQLREDEGRPCQVVNVIPQYVRQVTGDMRQMKPAIKVIPVDDNGDEAKAKIREGVIRYVENRSDAPGVYFTGADSQVACGVGAWRVTTEYAHEGTFNLEMRIAPIEDALGVMFDVDARLPTREDGMETLVIFDKSRPKFKKEFPDATITDFAPTGESYVGHTDWSSSDSVRIGEYWYKKKIKKVLALLPEGKIEDLTDDPARAAELKAQGVRVEKRDAYKVCRALVSATEVLEGPEEWPGSYIPIVPVLGEEVRIGRRIVRHGMIRFAKDPQRSLNYMSSAETEVIALQPKAPWIGTVKNFEEQEDKWEQANRVNFPYLSYTPDGGNGGAPPSRVPPPLSSQGIIEGIQRAERHIQSVIGIYNASLGAKSNESSGVAVNARDRQADTGTYVYIDNWARAIRYTGKIIDDLMPHVYDTARVLRILGEDGKIEEVAINQVAGMDAQGQPVLFNDVTTGAYDIVLQMGPSYATKREESREGMLAFMQAFPPAAPLIGDLVAKAQDWPLADEIGERLETGLPPEIRAAKAEKEGKPLPAGAQPRPSPQEQEMQAKMQMAQQEAQLNAQLEMQKAQTDAETSRMKVESEMALKQQQAQFDMQLKREQAAFDMQLKREMAELEADLKQFTAASNAQQRSEQMAMQAAQQSERPQA
jgi:hypothetical protein